MQAKLRRPPVRYVMLFPGRTGSTYLTDHMANHPEIVANYEILSQHQESWAEQEQFLQEMIGTPRRRSIQAIGFKTKLRSVLDQEEFERHLVKNKYHIIHLTRSNPLKFVVSIVRAELLRQQNGSSNLIDSQHPELGPTVIPLADFAKAKTRLRRHHRLTQVIDRLNLPTMNFAYEDLLKNEQAALRKVWGFLGVRSIVTTGRTRKNTPGNLRNAVTNLDEIIDHHPEMARYVDQL
ncbi:MAG: hypothetical protein AAGA30_15370 [Planctomycetota bacterium]